jgi:hypothetical protein
MVVGVLIMKSMTFSSTPEFLRSMMSALLRWKTVLELRIAAGDSSFFSLVCANDLAVRSSGVPAENQGDRPPSGQWLSTQGINHFPNPAASDAPHASPPSRTHLVSLALEKLHASW